MKAFVENKLIAESEDLDLDQFENLMTEASDCGLNSEVSVLYAICNI